MYGLEVRGNLKLPFGGNDESAWMAGTLICFHFRMRNDAKAVWSALNAYQKFWGEIFCASPQIGYFFRNTALSVSEFLKQRRDADLVFDERTQAVD